MICLRKAVNDATLAKCESLLPVEAVVQENRCACPLGHMRPSDSSANGNRWLLQLRLGAEEQGRVALHVLYWCVCVCVSEWW